MHAFLCFELQYNGLQELVEIAHDSFYGQLFLLQDQLLSLSKKMDIALSSQPLNDNIDTKYVMTPYLYLIDTYILSSMYCPDIVQESVSD